ncbi:MAG: hypothetical protein ACREA2_11210 [Blastocatellia bacterium]
MAETTIKDDESKNSLCADANPPSSDGVGLPSKTTRWHKRKNKLLLWILAITVGIALSRELGIIDLELLWIDSSSQINIKSSSRYWEQGQERLTEKDYNAETTTTERAWSIGFDFPPDLDTEIETLIKKHLAEAQNIDVFQVKSKVSGSYLLPMFKDGHCKFSIKFRAKAASEKYFNGELIGAMDFDVKGACSQRKLRELLSKQMATKLVKYIESNIRE